MRILIFGASGTQGFWDPQGGWVQRLARVYHQKSLDNILSGGNFKVQLFNLGVSGDGVAEVAQRLEAEAKARIKDTGKPIILLSVGTNDARLRNNRAVMDVYEFQEIYEKVIDKALKFTDKVLCVGLSAVDQTKTDPLFYGKSGDQWHNNRINAFEDTVKQSAERKQIGFVPIHDQFLAALEAGQDLLAEGMHPNEAGHQLIAELVKPALDALIAE